MTDINIVLQKKGGVGKTFVAALIMQQQEQQGRSVYGLDIDSNNPTLTGYQGLDVMHLDLVVKREDGIEVIDSGQFDDVIEAMAVGNKADSIVLDVGAGCYRPFLTYLSEHGAIETLIDMGHRVNIHIVIVGGQAQKQCAISFDSILKTLEGTGTNNILWLNEFFGPVEYDGKPFREMEIYKSNAKHLAHCLLMPKLNPDTDGKNLSKLLCDSLTFNEAIKDSRFGLMTVKRIRKMRDDYFSMIEKAVA